MGVGVVVWELHSGREHLLVSAYDHDRPDMVVCGFLNVICMYKTLSCVSFGGLHGRTP